MHLSCFRAARRDSDVHDLEPVRRTSTLKTTKMATLRRTFTSTSTMASHSSTSTRTSSNSSIAQLPPCPHLNDPKIDALMMPAPKNERPSRCLRLSFPRIYGNLVSEMKDVKGCRDWRTFAVFEEDDVDESVSAVEYAEKRVAEYRRKVSMLESF